MMAALKFVFILLEVLLLFNVLIFVHELGHFLAAKWRGLKIKRFAIWFGKPIWKRTINGVEFVLGTIPAGGYVALPQMAPMEAIEGKSDEKEKEAPLPPIPVLDKVIVAIAGPLFSFGLALIFAVLVWGIGRPVREGEATTVIGYVEKNGPADKIGLRSGDKILEVDGHKVTRWMGMTDSVVWHVVRSEGATIPFKVERDGKILEFQPNPTLPERKGWSRKSLRHVGIYPAETPMVARVEKGGAAERAGLQPNDLIVGVNGQRIYNLFNVAEHAQNAPDEPLILTVEREGETIRVPYSPDGVLIGNVERYSPADLAGLRADDLLIAINGKRMVDLIQVRNFVQEHVTEQLTLTIKSKTRTYDVVVTPAKPTGLDRPILGIGWKDHDIIWDQTGKFHVVHPNPLEQIYDSVSGIVKTVDALTSSKSGIGLEHMGGPIMIMRMYYMMFESEQGWRLALWFSVVINVNLALLNMLPIPVLDGGHIMLAVVEGVRRKPINVRLLEIVQTACAILLIGYILFVTSFDLQDLFGGGEKIKFAPPPSAAPAKP